MAGNAPIYIVSLLTACLLVGGIALKNYGPPPAKPPQTVDEPAPAKEKAEPDHKNLALNTYWISQNKQFLRELKALFQRRGLTCPAMNFIWAKGITPYGQKIEVVCGPPGTTDGYSNLHYAVYPERGMVSICGPITDLLASCGPV